MPPVPMTFRQAAKTDYIDGILVPKGTLFYIPVRIFPTPCRDSKLIWSSFFFLHLDSSDQHLERNMGRRCWRLEPQPLAKPATQIQLDVLFAIIHRRPTRLHRKDNVYYRDENRPGVCIIILISPPSAITYVFGKPKILTKTGFTGRWSITLNLLLRMKAKCLSPQRQSLWVSTLYDIELKRYLK